VLSALVLGEGKEPQDLPGAIVYKNQARIYINITGKLRFFPFKV
jgi:hypothetical protein